MKLKPRKVLLQVYFDQEDENGNLLSEPVLSALPSQGGEPEAIVLYPHQFAQLEAKVAEWAAFLEGHLAEQSPPQESGGNRAQATTG